MPCSRAPPSVSLHFPHPDVSWQPVFSLYLNVFCQFSLQQLMFAVCIYSLTGFTAIVKKTFNLDVSQGSSEVRRSVLVCHFQAFLHWSFFGTMQKNLLLTRLTQFHRFNLSNTHLRVRLRWKHNLFVGLSKKSRMSAAWCDHYVNIYLQRASPCSDLTSLSGGPGAERLEGIRISSGQAENVLNGSEKSADAARMNFKCVMGGLITITEQSEWVSRVRFDQIIEAGSFRGCRRSGPERNDFIYLFHFL